MMAHDTELRQLHDIESQVPLCADDCGQVQFIDREDAGEDNVVAKSSRCTCFTNCVADVYECFSECEVMAASFKNSSLARYGREFCTPKNARRKFPFINWLPHYRLKHFVGDLVAGLTVGLTVIPQGLAYALVAELPPQYGLYSAFMGVFVYAFLGTSKDITIGPTAIMSLLVAEFASEKSPIHNDPTYAIMLTFCTGLIQLLMGLLNMGFIVQFISFPVISGFTSAAAILIAFGQVRKWFGLKNVSRSFIPQFRQTFEKIGETNISDMVLGLICLFMLIGMKKLKELADSRMKQSSGAKKAGLKVIWLLCTARNAVIVVICAGVAAALHDIYDIKGPGSLSLTGTIQAGMPLPAIPKFSLEYNTGNTTITKNSLQITTDIAEGFIVITLIGMLESIAIAKAFARRNEYKIDASQELIAIGVANAVSSFFHSYPVTGSFSRTAINSQSGVRTPAAGIWTGALVIVAIVLLTPYFFYIPQAALAAVIIAAVIQMVEYDVVITLWRVKKLDLLPWFLTFFVCIFRNVEYGIIAGVGISLFMVLIPMARPGLKVTYEKASDHSQSAGEERSIVVLEPAQGLTFPGVEYIKDKVMKHGVYEDPPNAIILNAAHFANCDYTMIQGITQLCDYFAKHNLIFVIACCPYDIRESLLCAKIKEIKFYDTVEQALRNIFCGQYLLPIAAAAAADTNEDYPQISSRHNHNKADSPNSNGHTIQDSTIINPTMESI